MTSRRVLVLVGLLLALAVPLYGIFGKERLLAAGTPMLLELAPVDPRSLIQGDYMRLNFALADTVRFTLGDTLRATRPVARDGSIVVRLDSDSVASFVRHHAQGQPTGAGEHLLRWKRREGRAQIGTNAFFFQEGTAERYARARYGEFRVGPDGSTVLVGMRDSTRQILGSVFER